MLIKVPKLSLILLVGPSGCGKSTFARRHFLPTEVVSSDACRGIVSDDENEQSATDDAFALLHHIVRTRFKNGRLTVIDATNVQEPSRRELLKIAHEYHVLATAIVFDVPERVCQERNESRPDRQFGLHVVRNQMRDMRRGFYRMQKEFKHLHILRSPEEIDAVTIEREPSWSDRSELTGPFDIVGDVHGCFDELTDLLTKLGYTVDGHQVTSPAGRTLVFVGDLVDRGPKSPDVLRLAMSMVAAGTALCAPGNHDMKLLQKLRGKDVKLTHGLDKTMAQLEGEPPEFLEQVREFLYGLVSHAVLDGGKLVVAHAGLKAEMHGRASSRVREFCLYGDTTGEIDEFGLPVRYPWATEYRGRAMVVYGHTPIPQPEWLNGTINIDTGCVFGGRLTALRYPERELVSVPAREEYAESRRPFLAPPVEAPSAQHIVDDVLDLEDVTGKRLVETRLRGKVTIREENATAALEVMSRFAANPKWLVYLPPTMSPSETSTEEGYLEYPVEAFTYFREQGVETVVCEEKHMGSRTVVVLCRDEAVARRRFGVEGEGRGVVLTRTGRRFFENRTLEFELLDRLNEGITRAGLWEELRTDWVVLDAELMPWSAKAQELLRRQYAPVGAAAQAATSAAVELLDRTSMEGLEGLRDRIRERHRLANDYVAAYARYCWPVTSVDDLRLAPFHLLASEGAAHVDKPHTWHMETLGRFCDDGVLFATPYRVVRLSDDREVGEAIGWWEERTNAGGEGMVIKPLDFIGRTDRGLIQPALKCRGREYLRIIYGPEYTVAENLDRLRKRGLSTKRSLAIREFALGVEALERFIRHEPLRRVHECVFGVLAMESEPVDPRL